MGAVLAIAIAAGMLEPTELNWQPPPLAWGAIFVPFGVWYLTNALAPEVQADPNAYHLQPAVDSLRHAGFTSAITFYDRLPHALEMLFVPAWRVGASSAAKLVHLGFLFATLPVIMHLARLLKLPNTAALGAAALYFCTPVVGFAGTAAFNDAALVYFTLAAVVLALEDRPWHAGLFAGFCYAIKMTGLLAVPIALVIFLHRKQWKRAIYVCIAALVPCLPWLLRNIMQTGNPFAPFLNTWFPNPFFYAWTEQLLTADLRHYGVPLHQRLPELLVGSRLQGILGPTFLLAPLALFALRRLRSSALILLTLAAVFSIPWWMNAGARFTMASLPFLALAMCAALPTRAMGALVALHAVTCWPSVISLYSPQALRLYDFPVAAAFSIESEQSYMRRVSADYRYAQLIDTNTPPEARILDLHGMHPVLSKREFVSSWRSAEGVRLTDGLEFARASGLTSIRTSFREQPVCGFKAALQTNLGHPWSIQSIDVMHRGTRVTNNVARWVSASRLSWEGPLAIDASPLSRWWTGQAGRIGDYLQLEFEQPVQADSIRLLVPIWQPLSYGLEICRAGQWIPVDESNTPAPELNLRPAAIQQLKQAGVTHIVAPASPEGIGVLGERLVNNADDWNLEVVANLHAVYLLKLR